MTRDLGGNASTTEFADAVIAGVRWRRSPPEPEAAPALPDPEVSACQGYANAGGVASGDRVQGVNTEESVPS